MLIIREPFRTYMHLAFYDTLCTESFSGVTLILNMAFSLLLLLGFISEKCPVFEVKLLLYSENNLDYMIGDKI